mgnify:CR=1 FL=1
MNISLLTKSEAVVAVKGTGLSVKSGVRAGVLYIPYRG